MRQRGNRKSATLLWILCTICTLFSRVCFDGVQAEAYLAYPDLNPGGLLYQSPAAEQSAYQESFSGSLLCYDLDFGEEIHQNSTSDSVAGCDVIAENMLRAARKGVPAQNAYVPESSAQGSTAFVPRKSAQRVNSRSTAGSISGVLPAETDANTLFSGQSALSYDGLCEVTSHTVILRYIHNQDGRKA